MTNTQWDKEARERLLMKPQSFKIGWAEMLELHALFLQERTFALADRTERSNTTSRASVSQ